MNPADPSRNPPFLKIAQGALPAWNIQRDATLTLLGHRENAVFAVDVDGERSYVLRVHRRGYHSDEELSSELLWMSALRSQGIPTPRVISTIHGKDFTHATAPGTTQSWQCDLLSWVDGTQLGAIESQAFGEREFIERAYEQVGRLAAQVHLHSERWTPPASFRRHSWDEEGCMGRQGVWGYYDRLEILTDQQRTQLRHGESAARRLLAAFGKAPDRYGLIHGDLVPENVLHDGAGGFTLIDFDDSGFGWYVGEIATAVFFHMGTPSFQPALEALIRGYRQVRMLSGTDLQMLDVMLFLRGMTLLGWIQTRGETQTALNIRPAVVASCLNLAATLCESLDGARGA